jgi:hypothetical protein
MSTVSTITVGGKTYTVSWATNQKTAVNKMLDTASKTINLEWTKPVIRDDKGKAVSATFTYNVYSTYTDRDNLNRALTITPAISLTTTSTKVTKQLATSNIEIGGGKHFNVKVTGTAKIGKTTYNIGTIDVFDGSVGVVTKTTFRQSFVANDGETITSGQVRLFAESVFELNQNIVDLATEMTLQDAIDQDYVDVVAQFREIRGSKFGSWVYGNVSNLSFGNNLNSMSTVPGGWMSSIVYNIDLPNTAPNKVYEISIGVRFPSFDSGGAQIWGNTQWVTKKFTSRAPYDNLIVLGDELVHPVGATQYNDLNTLPEIIMNWQGASISPTATTGIVYKTGATSNDIASLIRSIPLTLQRKEKNTLLVISVGLHEVAKTDPAKMVTSTVFKSRLKAAITAFLANNPNATVALFPAPYVDYVTIPVESERRAAATPGAIEMLSNSEYRTAWNTFAPNLDLGNPNPTWIKNTALGKLATYTSAMIQLTSELNTAYRKRVVMATDIIDPTMNTVNVDTFFINADLPPYYKGKVTLGYWSMSEATLNEVMYAQENSNQVTFGPDKFHFDPAYINNEIMPLIVDHRLDNDNRWGIFNIGDVVY